MKFRGGLWAAFCLIGGTAHAADKPRVGPPEAWVLPPPAAFAPAKASAGAALALLFEDVQVRFDAAGQSTFMEVQAKVQSGQGLAALGTVSLPWSPATDTLTVHRLRILRDGQAIDRLPKDGAFTVIRREARLETAAMLDGVLTAVVQPEGLQVGDVLDLAYTLRREDPLLKGRIDADLTGFDAVPLGALRLRTLWPKGLGVSWRVADGLSAPRLSEHDGQVEARIEAHEVSPLAKPQGAPLRFQLGREFTVSNYADWAAVSALMAPLFAQAEQLTAGSPVATEAKAVAARSSDPVIRTQAALALVQDKVRYLAQAIGDGGLKPATADETWTRRWGDCKAKTALLLALLKALGVQAEPVLASSVRGVGLDGRLPALSAFDHVLVRATIGGKDYWLDGTRVGDTSLAAIETPDFGFVLPVRPQGAALIALRPPPAKTPFDKVSVRIDATGGIDKPAPFHVERDVRGDIALGLKLQLANLAPDALDRALRGYWRGQYDFVEIAKVSAVFDAGTGHERLTMDGAAKLDWSGGGYEADGASLGFRFDAHRDPGPHADAPFAVSYPLYDLSEETILLPDRGKGFSVWGEDEDRELAGYAFKRHATVKDGAFHIETSSRALVPEISLAQGRSDAGPLTEMSKGTVRLRDPEQTAGAVADQKALLETQPTTFDGYLDRGNARLNARRLADALQDFDKAVALNPMSPRALADRGLTRAWLGQTTTAGTDLDAAEKLDPKEVVIWRGRAVLASNQGRWADAIAADTRALDLQPDDAFSLRSRADANARLKQYALALADIDRGLKADPDSVALLGGRAAILATMQDRKGALVEADRMGAASGASLKAAEARIMVLLRSKDRAGAHSEAEKLLKTAPNPEAWLLHAATRERGDRAGAEADARAAYALDPTSLAAMLTLAELREAANDDKGAVTWFEKAAAASPGAADIRVSLAEERFKSGHDADQAALDFAAARADAAGDPLQLNNVCYVQATLNLDLKTALADCDAALKLRPGDPSIVDSRAFVLLRLDRNADAKAAYDQALAAKPTLGASLYGRSLVERRLGDAAAADRDLKAATASDPKVVATFAGYGVTR